MSMSEGRVPHLPDDFAPFKLSLGHLDPAGIPDQVIESGRVLRGSTTYWRDHDLTAAGAFHIDSLAAACAQPDCTTASRALDSCEIHCRAPCEAVRTLVE
jgi:hypothetical protein